MRVPTPAILLLPVWPLPRSLATTSGISVDFSSSPYLDVSVQAVPHRALFDSCTADRVWLCRVSPFGYLRINAYLQLPEAFRSLSRPSSAPDAKAFPLRSSSLDLSSESASVPFRFRRPLNASAENSTPLRCPPLGLLLEKSNWFSNQNYAGSSLEDLS